MTASHNLQVAEWAELFELAPVSLWLEDYSALRRLFERWRAQGVHDLRDWLRSEPSRVAECSRCLRVLQVNRRTLELYGAESLEQLVAELPQIFRDDMLDAHVEELAALWEGRTRFSSLTVNYTLSGQRLDIQLNATVLPGHEAAWDRVLVSIEDVTARSQAQRAQQASELYARGLFEHSPVSLWVEDFSSVKRLLDDAREQGISDFRTFTDVHPEFVSRCLEEIRVIDVNRQTLTMFGAPDKPTLLKRLNEVFRDEMQGHFTEQLIDLWNGKTFHQREVVNYSLAGDKLHVYLQFSVLPGHEHDWGLVLISLTDITARKQAEAYLEFLGKHDPLTKLRNRAFFVDEMNRLERKGPWPVTVIVADLNGLKGANDHEGHAAGDALLRRAGEVLAKAVEKPACAARVGGDEFVLLLPGTDERGGAQLIERLHSLIELNNQFYGGRSLSFAFGMASCMSGDRLEATVNQADHAMYDAKKAYYTGEATNRRRG
ncbi:MAG: diguanylate cyclase [Rhizobacter sp.]|nr:diguanylate cyclase [Rhizobacter sp.]